MTIKLIVALDPGNVIGWSDGRLAYTGLKQDMARFKELTTGHTVVMGFNTFKSLNRPNGLPNRRNIVLTRKNPLEARGLFGDAIEVVSSLDWVEHLGDINRRRTAAGWYDEPPIIWIIGGASVYEEALKKDMVDEIYMTLIHGTSEGDVRLTTDLAAWKRFILTERKRGVNWEPIIGTRQRDGDFETFYLQLKRQ